MIRNEGRCITIARVRARMTSAELAGKLFYSTGLIKFWEYGMRQPPWDQLYSVLPELRKIREVGCDKYCPKAEICKKTGKCTIATSSKSMMKRMNMVEVVRCKNCTAYDKKEFYCEKLGITCMQNDYCSYGESGDDHG